MILKKWFQFQIGAIKSGYRAREQQHATISFNSKLVRLKDPKAKRQLSLFEEFQFQIGAIKSGLTDEQQAGYMFQFQIGAIKRQAEDLHEFVTWCFNSKLVRLKVNNYHITMT